MVFNATCKILFQLYHGGQFYWWRKPDYPDLPQDSQNNKNQMPLITDLKIDYALWPRGEVHIVET
jgi:hypothetical protein